MVFRGWTWGIEIDGIKHVSRHRFGIKSTPIKEWPTLKDVRKGDAIMLMPDGSIKTFPADKSGACPCADSPRMNQAAPMTGVAGS